MSNGRGQGSVGQQGYGLGELAWPERQQHSIRQKRKEETKERKTGKQENRKRESNRKTGKEKALPLCGKALSGIK